jgi:hypothetical protein
MGERGSCWEVRLLRYSGVWADAVLSVQMAGSCGTERLIVCLWPAVVQSVWGLHSRSCFQVAVQTRRGAVPLPGLLRLGGWRLSRQIVVLIY